MKPRGSAARLAAICLSVTAPGWTANPDRDFSGKWTLDPSASRVHDMPAEPVLVVVQQEDAIRCSNNATYKLDGSETRFRVGDESRNTAVKWEGSALLTNTLVSGAQDYTIMDRWQLSPDHAILTITRQVIRGTRQTEGVLVYRSEAYAAPEPRTQLATRPEARPASPPTEYVVAEGTHIPLSLRNAVNTKHSQEGDRIYLETVYPIASGGRIVIPRGSFVNGTVTTSKAAGRGKKKGELHVRFDSLTLPNGVTRDFRSRLVSAEGRKVDRDEGKITGESDKSHDARTVATTAGMGGTLGGVIGGASGAPLKGVGIGGAAGAAAGLAGVFMKKGPDATLPRGTTVEMVLDRDLRYSGAELR
jgi:type IV secretion system protein VirB10